MTRPRTGLPAVALTALASALAAGSWGEAATIRGRVRGAQAAPPKVAARYPGSGGGTTRALEAIPAVVFLDGPVAGVTCQSPLSGAAIAQKDQLFHPSVLVVPVGSNVSFPNQDNEFHNVFSYSAAKRFDLGRYPRGETKSVLFDHPGIVKVYCEIHPWMRAAVVVVSNPFHTTLQPDGSFTLGGVPPGRYSLVVWSIDTGSRRVDVSVSENAETTVDVALGAGAPPALREETMTLGAAREGREALSGSARGGGCCVATGD
jgi:plastocyanin